jgi:hypothetical protein
MRHPFDGLNLAGCESEAVGAPVPQTRNEPTDSSHRLSRREWLDRLCAAVASTLILPMASSIASERTARPPANRQGPNLPPGQVTTQALGEEGNPPQIVLPPGQVTTLALGEEGNPPITKARNEEGVKPPRGPITTFALGEEGNPPKPPTMAWFEAGQRVR